MSLRKTIQKSLDVFLKHVKIDALRYLVLKPLFKSKGQQLNGFRSLAHDQFFIYQVGGTFLPATGLHWFSNYPDFEDWCDRTALYHYKVQPGDTILDIGAGIGEEIIVLSKRVGKEGKIYAIEANPRVSEVLSKVKELNELQNTEVYNLAISISNEKVELANDGDSFLSGSIGQAAKGSSTTSFLVEGSRLDSFLEAHHIEHIDLLKCNIEGAERFVVDSIGANHLRRVRNVAIACHDFRYREEGNPFFKTKEYVADFLVKNGFEISSQTSGVVYIDDYIYGVNKNI